MRIEQLQQLMKIVETGSMNEAAGQMYMARSSLSTSMKSLEKELGGQIFNRDTRGVRLTPFGADVYHQAKNICERIIFLQNAHDGKGPARLSVSSHYCTIANEAFAEMYRRHQDENFSGSIEECPLGEVIGHVGAGLSEIGIITVFSDSRDITMRKLEENGLEFHKLMDRQMCAIIGPENPLYGQGRTEVTMKELEDYPYIENYASPSEYSWECAIGGRSRAEGHLSDLGCALHVIETTRAFMTDTCDRDAYRTFYAAERLEFIPLADLLPACCLGWIRRTDRVLSAVAEEFLRMLEEKTENLQEFGK